MAETHVENSLLFEATGGGFSSGDFLVHSMRGREALSTLYEFEVVFTCMVDGGIAPDAAAEMLDGTAQIGFGVGGTQRISGVLRELELYETDVDAQRSAYRALLVPRFWLTTLTRRSRCLNEMTVPDVIRQVLVEHDLVEGTDFELRLTGSYPEREYIVQYEETDFAFLCRWMERLGIFYTFEHGEEREKLVITDANSELVAAPIHGEVVYSARRDAAVGGLHNLRRIHRKVPRRVHVRDFNWRTPGRIVHGAHDVDADHGKGLQAFYGDHFKDDGEGATYAQMRAEGLAVPKTTYAATSVNLDFAPGYRITLSGSPVGDLDLEYVITEVIHESTQERGVDNATYQNSIRLIEHATPYRPPRVTPWPRIDGVMHAKIDAESISSAAPIDDQGRYRVVIPYDLYGKFGGKATRWVRKAEPYTGPAHGMHFTLHSGAEVLLAHTGGDPDRPVIVAAAPNPATGSPLTSTHATRSAIRTRSGILLDFEDDA